MKKGHHQRFEQISKMLRALTYFESYFGKRKLIVSLTVIVV